MAANEIPETLVINLKFSVDRDWIEEYIADGEEVTLQMMLDALREQALEWLADDAYNMVQTADVFDGDGNQVC
jgi:hypothetical protein